MNHSNSTQQSTSRKKDFFIRNPCLWHSLRSCRHPGEKVRIMRIPSSQSEPEPSRQQQTLQGVPAQAKARAKRGQSNTNSAVPFRGTRNERAGASPNGGPLTRLVIYSISRLHYIKSLYQTPRPARSPAGSGPMTPSIFTEKATSSLGIPFHKEFLSTPSLRSGRHPAAKVQLTRIPSN